MKQRIWRWLQVAFVVLSLALAARLLAAQWKEVSVAARALEPSWKGIALSSVLVLATYAALIQSWRILVAGWGSRLPYPAAVRIWTIANLGRYIPGKVWSVGALGVLAQREGVSGTAAAGSAILGTLLQVGAGFGVVALSGNRVREGMEPWLVNTSLVGCVLFVMGILALPWLLPPTAQWLARRLGRPVPNATLPAVSLWLAVTINALAWVAYGTAFMLFSRAILPGIAGALPAFVAVFTASYLAGYLLLFAPGGIVYRELSLIGLVVALGLAGKADATLLALTSRLWLTVLELAPGLVCLLLSPVSTRRALRPNHTLPVARSK